MAAREMDSQGLEAMAGQEERQEAEQGAEGKARDLRIRDVFPRRQACRTQGKCRAWKAIWIIFCLTVRWQHQRGESETQRCYQANAPGREARGCRLGYSSNFGQGRSTRRDPTATTSAEPRETHSQQGREPQRDTAQEGAQLPVLEAQHARGISARRSQAQQGDCRAPGGDQGSGGERAQRYRDGRRAIRGGPNPGRCDTSHSSGRAQRDEGSNGPICIICSPDGAAESATHRTGGHAVEYAACSERGVYSQGIPAASTSSDQV